MDKQSMTVNWKRFMPLVMFVVLLFNGCSTSSDFPYSYSDYKRGKVDAERDVAANILATEVYGFGAADDSVYGRLLKQRYGIEQRVVAGCIVNAVILGHAKGYNEVSHHEIERRFGKDIWKKLAAEEIAFTQANR